MKKNKTTKKKVKLVKPDPIKAEKEILKFAGKGFGEKEKGILDISNKYNVTKTFLNKILSSEELKLKTQAKAIEKAQEENLKKQNRKEKEAKKLEKETEEAINKELQKEILDRIEKEWQTCEDELFINCFEIDYRKAQHYFAKRLMHENVYKTFKDNNEVIVYNKKEGIYEQDAHICISITSQKRLGEKCTDYTVKEITHIINRSTYIDRDSIYNYPKDLIPVKQGILNIETKELITFDSKYVFLSKVDVNFKPESKCPMWDKYLKTSLVDKHGDLKEKTIKTMQEFAGYIISNDNSKQKAFIAHGNGAEGKSIYVMVIASIVGEKNTCFLSVQQIEKDRFASARLFGKKLNVNPDLPKKALGESSRVKKIIRGEPIDVEKKGKDGYPMIPMCKQLYACNQVPQTDDHSDGFYRSWLVAKFEKQFLPGDPDRIEDLDKKIISSEEEKSGILNWMLEGLDRLNNNGEFTENLSIAEIKDFWLENSDSVSSFFKKMIVQDESSEEIKQEVYELYVEYCQKSNIPKEEQNKFFERFNKICNYKEKTPSSQHNDRRRRLVGIKLNSLNILKND